MSLTSSFSCLTVGPGLSLSCFVTPPVLIPQLCVDVPFRFHLVSLASLSLHAHVHMHTRKCSVRTVQHIGKRAVIPESGLSVHPASLIPSWVMDYVKSKPPLLCFSIFSCINGDTGNDLSKLMRIKRENILKSCECRTWHIVSPHDILLSRSVTSYHHETHPSPIAFVVC